MKDRIERIRRLTHESQGTFEYFEAAVLAQTVLDDTVGGSHPLMAALTRALDKSDYVQAVAASRGVLTLFDEGGLTSPRLMIAHELDGNLLEIAQSQVAAAENATGQRDLHLSIAAFLAGAALEDTLRRLCDANNLAYVCDTKHYRQASVAAIPAIEADRGHIQLRE